MIIELLHPGIELNLSRRSLKNEIAYRFDTMTTGYRFWNNEDSHKRKFIKHAGWYLENNGNTFYPKPKKADLYFWGEWESQSRFELTGNKYSSSPSLPHAVHYPVFSTRGIGGHNTDPFVFGEHFYYTNCNQGKYRILRILQNESIVIFGSEKNKTEFIIDTIFVVNSSETVADYHLHPTTYPKMLVQTTIDLHIGLENWHRLYKGKMYDFNNLYSRDNPSTFCFFPCKVDCEMTGFERPTINWRDFNLKKPGAGQGIKEINNNSENDFWQELVAELIHQGFSLGIKLEMPLNNNTEEFPDYYENAPKC